MDCIVHGGHKESDVTEWLSLSFPFNWLTKLKLPVITAGVNGFLSQPRKVQGFGDWEPETDEDQMFISHYKLQFLNLTSNTMTHRLK